MEIEIARARGHLHAKRTRHFDGVADRDIVSLRTAVDRPYAYLVAGLLDWWMVANTLHILLTTRAEEAVAGVHLSMDLYMRAIPGAHRDIAGACVRKKRARAGDAERAIKAAVSGGGEGHTGKKAQSEGKGG